MIRRITDYLEETYRKYPDKVSYTDVQKSYTFSELRAAAMHVAQTFRNENLFKKPIIVYMEKGTSCIVSFFGSAYSGNFYTPIDPSMPAARIEKIVSTLEPAAVITLEENYALAESLFKGIKLICLEKALQTPYQEEDVLKHSKKVIDTDLLYIIFTSGSTGMPKGVCLPHRAVIDYIEWVTGKFDFNENTILGNQVPLYFDLSIQDVFSPIKTGCTTHLIPPSYFGFPKQLMQYMFDRKVNTIVWVPTALILMATMKALKLEELPPLQKVLFAGEVMPSKQLKKWQKAYPDATFINMYGPTEVANIASWYVIDREIADDEIIPMGWPCENLNVLVLNENDQPVQGNEIGELCVLGTCLAHGYYNNPEKTKEVFVQNPLNTAYPEIMYRTGDLVRFNEYGEMVYVSRKDFQVKHMGYRIELGEIETAISSIEGVEMNCCLYDQKRSRIILCYEGAAEEQFLMEKASGLLPDYMLPNMVKQFEELPLNQNGKIDRQGLRTLMNLQ